MWDTLYVQLQKNFDFIDSSLKSAAWQTQERGETESDSCWDTKKFRAKTKPI